MDVLTFGSAKLISKEHFGSAINYVSLADPVPFVADILGFVQSCFSNDIRVDYLRSNDFPFLGHYFASDAYQRVLEMHGRMSQVEAMKRSMRG